MSLNAGDRVTFKEYDCPADQCCIQAGTKARVKSVEPPFYWVRLDAGGDVRVTEEHVEKQEQKPRQAGSAKGLIQMSEDFNTPMKLVEDVEE